MTSPAEAGRRTHSLSRRLLVSVTALLIAFGTAMTGLSMERASRTLLEELTRKATATASLLEPSCTDWVVRGQVSSLDRALGSVRAQVGVVDAWVLDPHGQVLADGVDAAHAPSGPGERRLANSVAAREATLLRHGDTLDSVRPLLLGHDRVGTLVIGFSLAERERAAAAARNRQALIGGVFVGIGVALVWLLSRGITRNLRRLTAEAQEAAGDQLPRLVAALNAGQDVTHLVPQPLSIGSRDEVGELADAFNTYRDVVVGMTTELTGLLRDSDARFRAAFDASPIGMAVCTPDGGFVKVNGALARLLGWELDHLVTQGVDAVTPPEDLDDWHRTLADLLAGVRSDQHERRFQRADGSIVWTLHTVTVERDAAGTPQYLFCQVVDTTERRRVESEMAHRAFHDPLTGLANRERLGQVLEAALRESADGRGDVAVMLLDLDNFKVVNDSLGHEAGDDLLREVTVRLREAVRRADTIARFGGDEFVVVSGPGETLASGEATAQRLLRALADHPVSLAGREVHVAASVGVAIARAGDSPTDVLRDADTAAYQAKAAGRGRVVVFDDALRGRADSRLRVEQEIRHGLTHEEFTCHYQPVVTPAGDVVGYEALARWQHPDGLRPPADFIEIAEQSGLILPLGRTVLRQACVEAATWAGLTLSVNVAPLQLVRDDLHHAVLDALTASGLPAHLLCLEITETALMDATAVSVLRRVHDLGVRIALDDFGTGYSSIAHLRRLPVDVVKIDRAFVRDVGSDPAADAVVAAIVDLARAMGLDVVAEGVEDPAQGLVLARLGCDLLQGFAYGAPAPLGAPHPEASSRSTTWATPSSWQGGATWSAAATASG